MSVEVKIPSLGESVSQGVISRWLKKNGDAVEADEILFELETDKASMEIPAEAAGTLEILKPEGAEVSVGTVVGRIKADGAGKAKTATKPKESAKPSAAKPAAKESVPAGETKKEAKPAAAPAKAEAGRPTEAPAALGPAARKLLAENDLDPASVAATGKGGRITKGDILEQLGRGAEPSRAPAAPEEASVAPEPAAEEAKPAPAPSTSSKDVERVPMTRLRQRIAERLVEAQRTAAILTTFNEIDMSAVMDLRRQYKERFQKTHGVGLGFMSLFGRAVIHALRDVPVVNAQIDGTDVVYHRRVHLGIAVGTERGLVVPVIRDADSMSIAALERAIGEMATLARNGKLLPDHLSGGTFTISNGGVYGSLLSTPILNPPQSGILGMHKIEERPVAAGGQVVIRPMMYVALSYDHRLVDGEQAVTFLVRVKERLEEPTRLLLEI